MSSTLDKPDTLSGAELQTLLGSVLQAWAGQQGALLSVKSAETGRYVFVNAAMVAFLGLSDDEILGRADSELMDGSLAAALRAAEQAALAQGAVLSSDHRFEWRGARVGYTVQRVVVGRGTGPRWLCALWVNRAEDHARELQLKAALEQIEQQQEANDRLRREMADHALRDPASGLHRRAHFEDQLCREVDLSQREHREFSIVFIELDPTGAKVLALGVAGEQRVLEAMGRLLRGGTRAMDAACRYDERRFAVLLSGVGLATAHSRMEGLRRKCATQIVVHEGQELGFTVSMGVASFPHTAGTQESLVGACESALGEAQRRGGNHVTLAAIRFDTA
jgi:diguanylate cyclase (GGDEF)-like protein